MKKATLIFCALIVSVVVITVAGYKFSQQFGEKPPKLTMALWSNSNIQAAP